MLADPAEPFLLADWVNVVMIHFEVDRDELQRITPFELDLFQGKAFVSLVAFTMRRMRPRLGGSLTAWLFRPIATHPFLNVRTYVRHRDESGIFFLAEWVPNALSLVLGPRSFGLPYRLAKMDYRQQFPGENAPALSLSKGRCRGEVIDRRTRRAFRYQGVSSPEICRPCPDGSLDAWLMERYVAFTHHRGRSRYFRVWHPLWHKTPVELEVVDRDLLTAYWPWMAGAELLNACGSPGFEDVWMGLPRPA
jgi:uncharacterized protein YqjF (DUF2071 family)